MRRMFLLAMLVISFKGMAQKTYTVSNDPDGGSLIYNGLVTFSNLDSESTFTWLKEGTKEYKPGGENLTYLHQHLNDYSMVVFLGTWCSDSHELIPKLEKILQLLNYPASQLTMYATDRDKKTKGGEQKKYKVTLVPTVILYAKGKEAGRITETVEKSIEEDLVNIIRKDKTGQQH